MAKKKQKLFDLAVAEQKNEIGELTERELYLCGLALYWGEGAKTRYSELGFSNTDPRMIRFYLKWLNVCENFPLIQ